jgi:hypothetical protein
MRRWATKTARTRVRGSKSSAVPRKLTEIIRALLQHLVSTPHGHILILILTRFQYIVDFCSMDDEFCFSPETSYIQSPLRMANSGVGYRKTGFVEDMSASEDEGGGVSLE